ncbi:PD-(D/E)XK nuclease family protein, partial [Variovorax sp. CT11-76]
MNEGHPVQALWCDPADGVVARIVRVLAERQAHAARTMVLVPYAQLMGVAQAMWARSGSPGFVPRFETTRNWARSAGGFVPSGYDIAFDMARDLVTAQGLLSQTGFGAERFALAGRERDADQRALDAEPLRFAARIESALIRIAVAWAANASYATDVLLREPARAQIDVLIVLEGFQTDPLTQTLCGLWGERAVRLSLVPAIAPRGQSAAHVAIDPEDEAELAAA